MSVAQLGLGGECDSSAVASGCSSEVGAVAGAEEVDEERGAEEGGDDADRQLGGGDDVARDCVGEQEEDAAADESGRHEQAVVRPQKNPEDVRHNEPDESER